MNLLDLSIGILAPHHCIVCGVSGTNLCDSCRHDALLSLPSRCYRCLQASLQHQVCKSCRRKVALSHVWVATSYSGNAKELVHKLKYERVKQIAEVIAVAIEETLPILPEDTLISHVPTANKRIRVRGYDQAQLVAKELAKRRKLKYVDLLVRRGASRQVGSSRKERFQQLEDVFSLKKPSLVQGRQILLIDDVLTTGATVESAAKVVKKAGAKTVDAALFAQA